MSTWQAGSRREASGKPPGVAGWCSVLIPAMVLLVGESERDDQVDRREYESPRHGEMMLRPYIKLRWSYATADNNFGEITSFPH